MTAHRIQLRRTKGWRMPPDTVKVDRSTRWGNPFTVADMGSAQRAVQRFDEAVRYAHPDSYIGRIIADIHQLRGKNLACWCPIISHGAYVPCHADVLLSLANGITLDAVTHENTRRAKGETL